MKIIGSLYLQYIYIYIFLHNKTLGFFFFFKRKKFNSLKTSELKRLYLNGIKTMTKSIDQIILLIENNKQTKKRKKYNQVNIRILLIYTTIKL